MSGESKDHDHIQRLASVPRRANAASSGDEGRRVPLESSRHHLASRIAQAAASRSRANCKLRSDTPETRRLVVLRALEQRARSAARGRARIHRGDRRACAGSRV